MIEAPTLIQVTLSAAKVCSCRLPPPKVASAASAYRPPLNLNAADVALAFESGSRQLLLP